MTCRWEAPSHVRGFSFHYGGCPAARLLTNWTRQATEDRRRTSVQRAQREVVYRDPATGLETPAAGRVSFTDFPAVEWVVSLQEHTAPPILRCWKTIQALDGVLPVPTSGEATLHWAKGGGGFLR